MSYRKCAVSFYGFTSWILLNFLFCHSEAALKIIYTEELCYGWNEPFIQLRQQNTGILTSISNDMFSSSCNIRLLPERGSSVVLSLYRYNLGPQDQIIIEDSNKFRVALLGEGDFPDERKAFVSDGPMNIYYFRNSSAPGTHSKLRFQFVFTQVHDAPCRYGHFKCRNNKCIPKNLQCDRHNHCGDNSDQEDCGPRDKDNMLSKTSITVRSYSTWMIIIVVCSVILGIVILAFIGVSIRICVQRKKKSQQSQLPTVAASVVENPPSAPADVQQMAPHPSVFNRIRQSFRSLRQPKVTAEDPQKMSDSYEVPSMYPQIPSAPDMPGVDNENFQADE